MSFIVANCSVDVCFRRMVLVIGGVGQEEPPPDTRSLYLAHPVYRDSASQMVAVPTKVVGPLGLLYVQQREMAVTVPHDSKSLLHYIHTLVMQHKCNVH